MSRRGRSLFPVLAFLLITGTCVAAAEDAESGASVTTRWSADVLGLSSYEAQARALTAEPISGTEGFRLEAQHVRIETSWWRGFETVGAKVVTDQGTAEKELEQVTLRFTQPGAGATFLVREAGALLPVAIDAANPVSLLAKGKADVVALGSSPRSMGTTTSDAIGYWYSIDEPIVTAGGEGTVRADGSFRFVAYQVVIGAEGADGSWTGWTGYRESEPSSGVRQFELRITEFIVTSGTFATSSAARVGLYASALEVSVDGLLTTPSANGRLLHDRQMLFFEDDPLRLRGKGVVTMATVGAGSATTLVLWPSGSFEIHGASRVEALPGSDAASSVLPLAGFGGLAVAALATGGLVALGVVPVPTERSRERRFELRFGFGRRAARRQDWARAARWFGRAARTKPDDPLAWFEWAHCAFRARDFVAGEEIARRAAQVPGIDLADLLDLRARAAWEREDREAFDALLVELERREPVMAKGLVLDLGLNEDHLYDAKNRCGAEVVINGYA